MAGSAARATVGHWLPARRWSRIGVAAAAPPQTLVIAEALIQTNALANLVSFVNAGGRAIVDYLALQTAGPDLERASQVFAGLPPFTVILYDWGNSSLFDNLNSPL